MKSSGSAVANTLAHAAFMLAGLVLTLGAARALLQMAGGPVVESELIHASGTLTMVSPCSTGRNAHFSYRVNAQPAPVKASKPDQVSTTLALSVK